MEDVNSEATGKIKAAIENLREALHDQLSIIQAGPCSTESEIEKIVAERRQLAKSLELEKKFVKIWDEIRFYPTFFKRDDWSERREIYIDEPESHKKGKEETVSFKLLGKYYTLSAIEKERGFLSYDDDEDRKYPYDLILKDHENKLLLHVGFYRVHDEVGMFLEPGWLTGFVPGEWLSDFIVEYERMVVIKEKSSKELDEELRKERLKNMKNNFGID